MIKIYGQASGAFPFPAGLHPTFAYFRDIAKILSFMPHLSLLGRTPSGDLRVRYSSTELGSYQINVICDIRPHVDDEQLAIRIEPIDNLPAITPESTLSSTSTRGYYSCTVSFVELEPQLTSVEYSMLLEAKPPKPTGLRFMPAGVVNRIVQSITQNRIQEVANGLAENSRASYLATLST